MRSFEYFIISKVLAKAIFLPTFKINALTTSVSKALETKIVYPS